MMGMMGMMRGDGCVLAWCQRRGGWRNLSFFLFLSLSLPLFLSSACVGCVCGLAACMLVCPNGDDGIHGMSKRSLLPGAAKPTEPHEIHSNTIAGDMLTKDP